MKRFHNILVVCTAGDASALGVRRAERLARENKARVTLVDVVDTSPSEMARLLAPLSGSRTAEIADQILQSHRDRLDGYAAELRKAGIEVKTALDQGTPFLRVIRRVLDDGHDLVVKTAVHDDSPRFFASDDMHLMRKCPCPVWMVNDSDTGVSRRILAAVDPDPTDPTRDALNRVVMELATSLGERNNAEVEVINVWRLLEENTLRSGRITMSLSEVESILDREREDSRARLDAQVAPFRGVGRGLRVVHEKGFAGEVIPEYVASSGADTLVMGTIGRTGIRGLFIGNTAEAILNAVDCSVIAVKPPGFVSPLAQD